MEFKLFQSFVEVLVQICFSLRIFGENFPLFFTVSDDEVQSTKQFGSRKLNLCILLIRVRDKECFSSPANKVFYDSICGHSNS